MQNEERPKLLRPRETGRLWHALGETGDAGINLESSEQYPTNVGFLVLINILWGYKISALEETWWRIYKSLLTVS